ncbi:MAG: succinylglutamate desuccinylase/aspartoacylase family protein [Candidatus Lustribacter sp.]
MIDDILLSRYADVAAAWRALRSRTGMRIREVACVGAARTLLVAELGDPRLPVVTISAGIHGDEPAGVWALYSLVADGLLDPRYGYRLWPCFNPTGFDAGTRTNAEGTDVNRSFGRGGTSPEAKAILTANRDRVFALSIDLHEDHEAAGFYLYETAPSGRPSSYAGAVTAGLRAAGFPLQPITPDYDLGPPGSEVAQTRGVGAVIVDAPRETPFFGGALPLGLVLVRRAVPCALTFETPRGRAPAERVAMHRTAVVEALRRLTRERSIERG